MGNDEIYGADDGKDHDQAKEDLGEAFAGFQIGMKKSKEGFQGAFSFGN
jgi:hypothetical protein